MAGPVKLGNRLVRVQGLRKLNLRPWDEKKRQKQVRPRGGEET